MEVGDARRLPHAESRPERLDRDRLATDAQSGAADTPNAARAGRCLERHGTRGRDLDDEPGVALGERNAVSR